MRSGIDVLSDIPGTGAVITRLHVYQVRLRIWLNKGEAVCWPVAWGPVGRARLEDEGRTLITDVRIDRRSLIAGLFHGMEGMRIGGTRTLKIAPHLAYGERGVPDVIPAKSVLTAEVTVLEEVHVVAPG